MSMKRTPGISIVLIGFLVPALILSVPAFARQKYQDGTFIGIARKGPFQVKLNVVISDDLIRDVVFLELSDWKNNEVKSEMRRRILEKQNFRVDALSGATLSSNLISEAMKDALSAAALPATPVPASSRPPAAPDPRVFLETNRGTIELKLFPKQAPMAVENFLGLVKQGYYDDTVFHRVIRNFMIQGGDPTGTGRGGRSIWDKPFPDEFSPELQFNKVGLLAMANSGPGTNRSQFFITVAKTPWLNRMHTIFGEVVSGFEVVEAISRVPTVPGDRSVEAQKIIRAYAK